MSGRARGKHNTRLPEILPDSGEGREIGMSERTQGIPSPIPGGRSHIINPETMREKIPVPDSPPEIKDINAHGVEPDTHTSRERADMERGPNSFHGPRVEVVEDTGHKTLPVPVYIVEQAGGPAVFRSASPRHFSVQASTGEAVRLCGRDPKRVRVGLLNESTTSDIRFAQNPADLVNGGGALLPWPSNSYVWLETQDELYAISKDSGTPTISVIQEFDQPW